MNKCAWCGNDINPEEDDKAYEHETGELVHVSCAKEFFNSRGVEEK